MFVRACSGFGPVAESLFDIDLDALVDPAHPVLVEFSSGFPDGGSDSVILRIGRKLFEEGKVVRLNLFCSAHISIKPKASTENDNDGNCPEHDFHLGFLQTTEFLVPQLV